MQEEGNATEEGSPSTHHFCKSPSRRPHYFHTALKGPWGGELCQQLLLRAVFHGCIYLTGNMPKALVLGLGCAYSINDTGVLVLTF